MMRRYWVMSERRPSTKRSEETFALSSCATSRFMEANVEVIVADVSSGAGPEDTRNEQKSYPWMRDICNP